MKPSEAGGMTSMKGAINPEPPSGLWEMPDKVGSGLSTEKAKRNQGRKSKIYIFKASFYFMDIDLFSRSIMGKTVEFFTPEGLLYGTLLGYDGRVSHVRENYYDMDMPVDANGLKPLSGRDRIIRLESILDVMETPLIF